jgi:hypothetical protein
MTAKLNPLTAAPSLFIRAKSFSIRTILLIANTPQEVPAGHKRSREDLQDPFSATNVKLRPTSSSHSYDSTEWKRPPGALKSGNRG